MFINRIMNTIDNIYQEFRNINYYITTLSRSRTMSALVQELDWRPIGANPFLEAMLALTQIVTQGTKFSQACIQCMIVHWVGVVPADGSPWFCTARVKLKK